MPAALSEAMRHLFHQTPVTLIEARTSIQNRRSRRVLEKCGFTQQSSFSQVTTPFGLQVAELVFRLHREQLTTPLETFARTKLRVETLGSTLG